MRLCVFEAGRGPRLGVVRRNHIVDVAAVDASLPTHRAAWEGALPEARARIAALADSCPTRAALLRRDYVRILDEWDA